MQIFPSLETLEISDLAPSLVLAITRLFNPPLISFLNTINKIDERNKTDYWMNNNHFYFSSKTVYN